MESFTCIPVGVLKANCCLVKAGDNRLVLIDPGAEPERILAAVGDATVDAVLLTHGHYDHTGAVDAIVRATGAEVCLHALDAELLADRDKNAASRIGVPYREVKPDVLLQDGDRLRYGSLRLEVLHTPGHTKGSVVFKGDGVLFCGDTLFKGNCGRTDLYGGSASQMRQSLARLAAIEGDYVILSGHGAQSTLTEEKQTNPYLRAAMYETDF